MIARTQNAMSFYPCRRGKLLEVQNFHEARGKELADFFPEVGTPGGGKEMLNDDY